MSDKMRSRTELVTTTFVDSEEDYSDEDDSGEDWRPSASSSKNGKKQKQQKFSEGTTAKRGRKRKSSLTTSKNLKRKTANEDSEDDDLNEPSEDDYDYNDFETVSMPTRLPPRKQFSDKTSSISSNDDGEDAFNLLVYVKDLLGTDLNKNNRLCLWRKDNNNLLQKYIRVKTSPEQFLFTSSSVYSSFDDKRISDFSEVQVKSIDATNRRVKIINPSELQKLALRHSNSKANAADATQCNENIKKAKETVKKPLSKYNQDEDDEEEKSKDESDEDEEEDDEDLEENDEDDIEEYGEDDD